MEIRELAEVIFKKKSELRKLQEEVKGLRVASGLLKKKRKPGRKRDV
jgi:hypothetical protein